LFSLPSWLGCVEVVEPVSGPAALVQVHPTGMSISGGGATAAFTVVALNASGDTITAPAVTWSSLNPHVATIDDSGKATAVASGQVTVAAAVDGQVGYALLTVSAPPAVPVTSWNGEVPAAFPLAGVWGTSSTDAYAVGQGGTILHFDGGSWSAMSSPLSHWLEGVWGTSSGDIYAVGATWDGARVNGTILHYDGSIWSTMTSVVDDYLQDVWGTSATDIYAVGGGGVLHYDGTAWSRMTSATGYHLSGVWGTSASDIYSVGRDAILHYDGT